MNEQVNQLNPKLFHFIFGLQPKRQQLHLIHFLCLQSCFEVNHPEQIFFYCYREPYGRYWELIKDRLTVVQVDLVPEVLACEYSDKLIRDNFVYAHHSDFIRVQQLNRCGGVYADLDTLFVQEYPEALYQHSFVLGEEPPVHCQATNTMRPSVCNAVLFGRKDSFFGTLYYDTMAERLNGTWANHSCFLAHELSEKYPEHVHLEPHTSFYKHLWTVEGIETLLLGCDRNFDGVYSMHLWAHLWWPRRREGFYAISRGQGDGAVCSHCRYDVQSRCPQVPAAGRKAALFYE